MSVRGNTNNPVTEDNTNFGDDQNRDASYVGGIENLEDAAMASIEVHFEMLLIIETFRNSTMTFSNGELNYFELPFGLQAAVDQDGLIRPRNEFLQICRLNRTEVWGSIFGFTVMFSGR
ncbi:unnamed protein product [Mucor hiemalis]